MERRAILMILVLAGAASAASGQNALGDGRALQRDLRPAGGYSRPNFSQEVRLRNALVTGNVGGGRSLQIASPYADSDDFRGELPTDSLFLFRRDSYGVNTGYRGNEAMQYQMSFATGYTQGAGYVSRGTPAGGIVSTSAAATRPVPPEVRYGAELAGTRMGSLRSSSNYLSTRTLTPALIGVESSPTGKFEVTSSGLLGVRVLPMNRPVPVAPESSAAGSKPADLSAAAPFITAYDELRERLEAAADPKTPPATKTPPLAPEIIPPARPDPDRPSPDRPSPGSPRPGEVPNPPTPDDPAKPAVDPTAAAQLEHGLARLRERLVPRAMILNNPNAPDGTPTASPAEAQLERDTLELLRDRAIKIGVYTRGDAAPGDLFADHLIAAQKLLGNGQFFDAEERFARAVAMRPGDVTAMAGRLHSQLGAGLYLSAAMNLRRLFESHPEAMAVKFEGRTMPTPVRLEVLRTELRGVIRDADVKHVLEKPAAALLLAYIGWQADNGVDVAAGLTAAREAEAEAATAARAANLPAPVPDPLLSMLEVIWLPNLNPATPAQP